MLLFFISFIAGVLTALAPCVLPLLPVIVGGSLAAGSRRRAYTICIALGSSVIAFTLLLKVSTAFIDVPQAFWEYFSGGILILFGFVMLFPRLWDSLPFVNKLNRSSNQLLASGYQRNSLWGDMLMGAALGPVFSSCSPTYFVILASVLPASFGMGLLDLLAYAVGLSGFLFVIAIAGQRLVDRLGVAIEPGGWFRRALGVLFIVVGLGVATGLEARTEAWLLDHGFDATRIELYFLGAPGNFSPLSGRSGTVATSSLMTPQEKSLLFPKAPELVAPDGYINTPRLPSGQAGPITIGEFKGKKVVLIDIWTYSCINCQRTLPYIKQWYDKYSDKGLEIIGVHTPEFAFEHVYGNVENAVRGFGIKYPVVLDNEYRTWNAFGNQFWPRKYLIDIDGYIVYDHAGEGNYDETERAIQAALAERTARLHLAVDTNMPITAPAGAVVADPSGLRSPETYFGAARNEYLGNGVAARTGGQLFIEPIIVDPNTLYLIGSWNIMPEYAESAEDVGSSSIGSDRIDYRYRAKSVYFVAGAADGMPVEVEVLRDSKPLARYSAGADVHFRNGRSYITVTENRLYKVIEDSEYGDHFLEFIISKPGLRAYTFTFG